MYSMFEMQGKVERDESLCDPQLDDIIRDFFRRISELSPFSFLQHESEDARELQKKVKASLIEKKHQIEERLPVVTLDNLIHGKYDKVIFETPSLTEEMRIVIDKHHLDFVERLFCKCTSIDTLRFWFDANNVKLPAKSLAIAVAMGNNIFVLRYLKEHGWLDNISKADQEGLIKRAQRFPGKGLEFLRELFAIKSPTSKVLL